MAELFAQGPRSAAVSISVLVNWLANFTVGLVFPELHVSLVTLPLLTPPFLHSSWLRVMWAPVFNHFLGPFAIETQIATSLTEDISKQPFLSSKIVCICVCLHSRLHLQ